MQYNAFFIPERNGTYIKCVSLWGRMGVFWRIGCGLSMWVCECVYMHVCAFECVKASVCLQSNRWNTRVCVCACVCVYVCLLMSVSCHPRRVVSTEHAPKGYGPLWYQRRSPATPLSPHQERGQGLIYCPLKEQSVRVMEPGPVRDGQIRPVFLCWQCLLSRYQWQALNV